MHTLDTQAHALQQGVAVDTITTHYKTHLVPYNLPTWEVHAIYTNIV